MAALGAILWGAVFGPMWVASLAVPLLAAGVTVDIKRKRAHETQWPVPQSPQGVSDAALQRSVTDLGDERGAARTWASYTRYSGMLHAAVQSLATEPDGLRDRLMRAVPVFAALHSSDIPPAHRERFTSDVLAHVGDDRSDMVAASIQEATAPDLHRMAETLLELHIDLQRGLGSEAPQLRPETVR